MQFILKCVRCYFMLYKSCINILRKTVVLAIGLLITGSSFGYYFWRIPDFRVYNISVKFNFKESEESINKNETSSRLAEKASIAKDFVNEHGYDPTYCFLLDMRIPSGKKRFFVYNLAKDNVETVGLVAHGKGSENGSNTLFFSNTPNSNCTSLGKYKIGVSYKGDFGLSYKLMGLDITNSKAYDRSVVLHSFCGVPKDEVYPASICVSEGCPTVSPEFLIQLKKYLDNSKQPILLWIYY